MSKAAKSADEILAFILDHHLNNRRVELRDDEGDGVAIYGISGLKGKQNDIIFNRHSDDEYITIPVAEYCARFVRVVD